MASIIPGYVPQHFLEQIFQRLPFRNHLNLEQLNIAVTDSGNLIDLQSWKAVFLNAKYVMLHVNISFEGFRGLIEELYCFLLDLLHPLADCNLKSVDGKLFSVFVRTAYGFGTFDKGEIDRRFI